MIEKEHPKLSIRQQADLLKVNRNRLDPVKKKLREDDEEIMKEIDVIYTKWPFYGTRKFIRELLTRGIVIGRKRCQRLMEIMGIEVLVPKPSLSRPNRAHHKSPHLLRNKKIEQSDETWAADITYIPME